jgi:hypothetical protein
VALVVRLHPVLAQPNVLAATRVLVATVARAMAAAAVVVRPGQMVTALRARAEQMVVVARVVAVVGLMAASLAVVMIYHREETIVSISVEATAPRRAVTRVEAALAVPMAKKVDRAARANRFGPKRLPLSHPPVLAAAALAAAVLPMAERAACSAAVAAVAAVVVA